jgi:hypothetical protein
MILGGVASNHGHDSKMGACFTDQFSQVDLITARVAWENRPYTAGVDALVTDPRVP